MIKKICKYVDYDTFLKKMKVFGQNVQVATDGASAMSGIYSGLVAKVKSMATLVQ